MIRRVRQAHWAILSAILFVGLLLAANAHLVAVAVSSQPECLPAAEGQAPARARC